MITHAALLPAAMLRYPSSNDHSKEALTLALLLARELVHFRNIVCPLDTLLLLTLWH